MDSTSDGGDEARGQKAQSRRVELIGRIADVLLADGVGQVPLRDLAARLGTSDRMLLYYFADKADLVEASIEEVSSRLGVILAASFSEERRPAAEVLDVTARLLSSPAAAPFMNVWADVSARGGRGEEPFQAIAKLTVKRSLAWLDVQLAIADDGERRAAASAILAVVEGVRMIDAAAPGSTIGVTEFLAGSFASDTPRS